MWFAPPISGTLEISMMGAVGPPPPLVGNRGATSKALHSHAHAQSQSHAHAHAHAHAFPPRGAQAVFKQLLKKASAAQYGETDAQSKARRRRHAVGLALCRDFDAVLDGVMPRWFLCLFFGCFRPAGGEGAGRP